MKWCVKLRVERGLKIWRSMLVLWDETVQTQRGFLVLLLAMLLNE